MFFLPRFSVCRYSTCALPFPGTLNGASFSTAKSIICFVPAVYWVEGSNDTNPNPDPNLTHPLNPLSCSPPSVVLLSTAHWWDWLGGHNNGNSRRGSGKRGSCRQSPRNRRCRETGRTSAPICRGSACSVPYAPTESSSPRPPTCPTTSGRSSRIPRRSISRSVPFWVPRGVLSIHKAGVESASLAARAQRLEFSRTLFRKGETGLVSTFNTENWRGGHDRPGYLYV